jgi:hypothetical protein
MLLGNIASHNFQTTLQKLAEQPLAPITAYKIKKILKLATEEIKNFETIKNDIIQTFAERDAEGKVKQVPGGVQLDITRKAEWDPQLKSLFAIEVELPKLKLQELGESVKLTALELMALDGLVDE